MPISSSLEESIFLIRLAKLLYKIFGLPTLLRPHPAVDISSHLSKNISNEIILSSDVSVDDDLAGAFLCIFVSSSVGAEAYFKGVPSICCITNDLFSYNPLHGHPDAPFCCSIDELIETIRTIISNDYHINNFGSDIYSPISNFSNSELIKTFKLVE